MIEPTEADIGRAVIYVEKLQGQQSSSFNHRYQPGVITSFNDTCVFVNYGRPGTTSAGTAREDLEWGYMESALRQSSVRCNHKWEILKEDILATQRERLICKKCGDIYIPPSSPKWPEQEA